MDVKMMNILLGCVVLIATNALMCQCDFVQDDTELLLAFMLHRHGDRTPVESTISYSTNPDTVELLTSKYGYGQLTDVGKLHSYELGKSIRRRYDSYLSPQYNRSEIYIQSTDSTRTKMTILAALAAIYPVDEESNWSNDINWTPVPYTTLPALYDTNLATANCPTFVNAYYSLFTQSQPGITAKYYTVLNILSEVLGANITNIPLISYAIYDVYASQISLGVPIGEELEAILPIIADLAADSMEVLFGSEEYAPLIAVILGAQYIHEIIHCEPDTFASSSNARLLNVPLLSSIVLRNRRDIDLLYHVDQTGVLLNDFFEAADSVIAGDDDVQKIQVYSAHDVNVFGFTAVTNIQPKQGVPKYNSLYSLELRKVLETGEYIVVPVYFKEPGVDEIYLQVDGCDGFCDLESFRTVTADNVLDTDEWRTLCEFSEDYDIDTSSLD